MGIAISNTLALELGLGLLGLWALSVVVMWFTINRKTRPGPVSNIAAIEGMMLVSMAALISGIALTSKGIGLL